MMARISKPAPRRLVLGGLVALALGLRLWGIGWSPAASKELAGLEVIGRIMASGPGSGGALAEGFYLLLAGWGWLVGLVERVGWWLQGAGGGDGGGVGIVGLRVGVAVASAAAVGLVWAVGRRWFSSLGTAALAAAMVATAPLLVGQGHVLHSAGLAPLGWAWAAGMGWVLAVRVGGAESFWAGVCTGLVASSLEGGILAGVTTWWGYWVGVRSLHPPRLRAWLLWPLAAVGGMILGVGLGAPGVMLRPLEALGNLAGAWGGLSWEGIARKATQCAKDLVWGGPVVVWVLAAVGGGVLAKARDWGRLGLVAGAAVGLMGAVMGPWEVGEVVGGATTLAALVAPWPVVLLCRRLGSYRAQVAAAAAAGVVLCAWGTYLSLCVAHGFWRPTSWEVAEAWIERNLPEGSGLWLGKGVEPRALALGRPAGREGAQGGFLLDRARDGAINRLVVKRFSGLGPWLGGPSWFPKGLSPGLVLYGPGPALVVLEPLALPRLGAASGERWRVVEPRGVYGRDEGVAWLEHTGSATRALTSAPAGVVGVELVGAGEDYSQVQVCIGPWCRRETGLYPGQRVLMLLPARRWPPLVGGLIPVEVRLKQGREVWARVMGDGLEIAYAAASMGQWQDVVEVCKQLVSRGQGGFEARVLMALGLVRQGKMDEARGVLGPVAIAGVAPCFRLGGGWEEVTGACGYKPELLRESAGVMCNVQGPPCISTGEPVPLRGKGWHGLYTRQGNLGPGELRISLDEPLPAGELEIVAQLGSPEPDGKVLGRMEVWLERLGRRSRVASRTLVSRQGGVWSERIRVAVDTAGSRLRVVLHYLGGELRLRRLWVGACVEAHIRRVLAWYYEAKGLVQLAAHRLKLATASLAKALELNPGSWQLAVALTEALAESGELAEAKAWAKQAVGSVWNFPEGLKRLEAVCGRLKLGALSRKLARRLAYLRPSLKHEALFSCGLKLLGYDLPEAKVRRGQQLKVTYYWQAVSKVPTDYFIFVHLRGPGRTLNFDHLLAGGKVKMNRLRPGEVVRESYNLSIPSSTPPGRYRLVVGLWDAHFTGRKLRVVEGQEAGRYQVTLGEIQLLP